MRKKDECAPARAQITFIEQIINFRRLLDISLFHANERFLSITEAHGVTGKIRQVLRAFINSDKLDVVQIGKYF